MTPETVLIVLKRLGKRAQIEGWKDYKRLEKWILSTLGESTEKSDVHPPKLAERKGDGGV